MSGTKKWGFEHESLNRVLQADARKNGAGQTKQLGRSIPRNQQVEEWSVSEVVGLAFIVGVVTFCFVWGFLDILNTIVTKGLLQ